eukprot:scaffold41484_cov15-Tisochrysis_lutea.AAC.1
MPPPKRSGGVGVLGAANNVRGSGGPAWGHGQRQGGSGRGVAGGGDGGGREAGAEGGGGSGGIAGEAGLGEGVGGVGGSTAQVPEVCMSSTGGISKQQAQG